MLCAGATLGMKDERNWSRGENVVVVIAWRRGSWDLALIVVLASLVFSAGSGAGPPFSCCSFRD